MATGGDMFKRFMWILLVTIATVFDSFAQQSDPDYRVELSGRVALGSLRIFGSNYSDSGTNLGAGIEFRAHRRFGIEFEVDRMMNVHPPSVPCGLNVPCVGAGVEGARSALHWSNNFLYYFPTSLGVEPYLLGGVGMLHSRSARAATFAGATEARIVQLSDTGDRGVSIGFGGGLRIPLGDRLSLRPELRLYDSSLRSRSNLGLGQFGVGLGVRW